MKSKTCYQVNLQQNFGGGEVYTRFFSEALVSLGWEVELFVTQGASFWQALGLKGVRLRPIRDETEIPAALPATASLIVTHTALGPEIAQRLADRHVLSGFMHMPLYERNPPGYACYGKLFAVSRHVLDSARTRGLGNVHSEPLYAVADLAPRAAIGVGPMPIIANSIYDWDKRKVRDRLMGLFAPLLERLVERPTFVRRPGLTLGIVSRLTPIKQFPLMFSILAPVLARYPQVNLEVFGSGGFASVRDLKNALAPVRSQVRYWGQQRNVAPIYAALDYVLSGLPEKEALGLNLIEAQSCGTPVLAVNAPPFTETVVDGRGGFLFEDPRHDSGLDFGRIIERLCSGLPRPDPRADTDQLARFSREAFRSRVKAALDAALAKA